MKKDNYELDVLVNGKPVKNYYHKNKWFIQANKGTEYSLRFKNNTCNRVLVIASVDGIDVMDGQKASSESRGYIVNALSSIEIKGYRASNSEVGAFKFGDGRRSYASLVQNGFDEKEAKQNPSENNGVIAVRVFGEKFKFPTWYVQKSNWGWYEVDQNWAGGAAPNSSIYDNLIMTNSAGTYQRCCNVNVHQETPAPDFDVGTSWGSKIEDKVTEVSFERADYSVDLVLYYASRKSLEKAGVNLCNKKAVERRLPAPFADYCRPPKNWK